MQCHLGAGKRVYKVLPIAEQRSLLFAFYLTPSVQAVDVMPSQLLPLAVRTQQQLPK